MSPWLDHWVWTLAVNILPCRRLWQQGWVRCWWKCPKWVKTICETLFPLGVVTSPNHPSNSPNHLDKTDMIRVEQGLIISLQFMAFDIVYHHSCGWDHLTIIDGDGTTLMQKSCGSSSWGFIVIGGQLFGSSLPPAIRSRSNLVNLVFRTDGSVPRSGWSVSWSAVTPGEFQQHI